MLQRRPVVPVWLLALIVVSCLFARPLHEALDSAQAAAEVASTVAMPGPGAAAVVVAVATAAVAAQPEHGVEGATAGGHALGSRGGAGAGGSGDPGGFADTCEACGTGGTGESGDAGDPAEPGGGGSSTHCAWCVVLAQAQAPATAPPQLALHAEACPPPAALPQGQPAGRCVLAAEPRGPPRA